MKQFLLVFRNNSANPGQEPSSEQMQGIMQQWHNWMNGMGVGNQLANPGNRISAKDSRIVKSGGAITDGPHAAGGESISGYIVVNAASVDDAAEIAKGCRIFAVGGNVEVRTVLSMDGN